MAAAKQLSYREALAAAKSAGSTVHALLGNGFSRACKDDIFSYGALFSRADFKGLSPHCKAAFNALGTTDFEQVIRALRQAAALVAVYRPSDSKLAELLADDADKLREVLVKAIASSHPDRPGDIPMARYAACKKFLEPFDRVYTLNYDLLLYWAYMQDEIEPKLPCDDGFRHPDSGEEAYVTWEVEKARDQKIYYVHGALHLFDSGPELQKYTWKNTGIALTDQIRQALKDNKYPLFVSEGSSTEKLTRIKHSGYLHRGLQSLPEIRNSMIVYGVSFGSHDNHVLSVIERGKISNLFVGLYGDPSSPNNQKITTRAQQMPAKRLAYEARRRRRGPPIELRVYFFDAASANVWG